MKTERMTILVTPEQKAAIMQRAKTLHLSAGEVVRRAVENYRPISEEEVVLNALAADLHKAAREARDSMKDALSEVQAALDYFVAKRVPKRRMA
jgi:hypothetical protein